MKSRGMLIRLLYDIGNNKEKWYAEDSDRFYISSGWEDIVIFASRDTPQSVLMFQEKLLNNHADYDYFSQIESYPLRNFLL